MRPEPTIDALVLRWVAYGETSQIVHLATSERGRVAALAKGSLRPGSACGGGLATAMRGAASLRRRRGDLDLLTSFRVVSVHDGLAAHLDRWRAAMYVIELLRAWMQPDLPAPDLFRAGTAALALLDRAPPERVPGWVVWFEARALAASGHRPALDGCAACGGPIDGGAWFHAEAGGLVHAACRPPGDARRVSRADREVLDRLYTARLGDLAREPLDQRGVAFVRALHDRFVPWILERRPRLLASLPRPGGMTSP